MPHQIDPFDHYWAGETLVWEFTVADGGTAKDLSGASVSYYLFETRGQDTSNALLSDSDAELSASIVDAANGRIDVTWAPDAVDAYGGQLLWQRLVIDDSSGQRQIFAGSQFVGDP